MHSNTFRRAALLAAATTLCATAAHAGTLTAVAPYSGATGGQSLLGINDAGWVTGGVLAGGQELGYLRDPTGGYTVFSAVANGSTEGRAISNANTVVGYTNSGLPAVQQEFSRTSSGGVTILTSPNGIPLNRIAQGINDAGDIVGNFSYRPPSGPIQQDGFILSNGGSSIALLAPDAGYASIAARGINNSDLVVGFAVSNLGGESGFVYNGSGYSYVNHPGATGTILEGLNNAGVAVGTWTDAQGLSHGFEYDIATQAFTDLPLAPDASLTAWGINNSGQVVLSSSAGAFIYTPGGPSAPDGGSVYAPEVGLSLPSNVSQFDINVQTGQTYYIDPMSASGFLYLAGDGPDFASVTAPTGFTPGDIYQLWLYDTVTASWRFDTDITGGTAFDFASPVSEFELRGIPESAGVDAQGDGFVTGLTFASNGVFDGQQIALGVPEPAAWALMIAGFGVAGARLRRRRRAFA